MGFSIKKAINSVKKTISNPMRLAGTVAGGSIGGNVGMHAGMLAGNQAGKKLGEMPTPPTFEGLSGAQNLQGNIIGQRLAQAEKFKQQLPDYIEGAYGSQKAGIDRGYDQARKNLVANLNARGILKSGQAKLQKGQMDADRAADLITARGNVIKDAYGQAAAYETDPLFSLANVEESKTRQQSDLDRLAAQRQAASQAILGSAAGSIGSGVGRGIANVQAGKGFGYGGTV